MVESAPGLNSEVRRHFGIKLPIVGANGVRILRRILNELERCCEAEDTVRTNEKEPPVATSSEPNVVGEIRNRLGNEILSDGICSLENWFDSCLTFLRPFWTAPSNGPEASRLGTL